MNQRLLGDSLAADIAALIGQDRVLTAPDDVAPYFRDFYRRVRGQARCVALPGNTDEVAAVVRLCAAAGEPVFPQGGNTSVCGGAVPLPGGRGVLLSLARMKAVRAIDTANNSMIVESGCVLAAVQDAAASVDRLFPLTLGAEGSCQIGGNVSTNAGGTAVLRYGNVRDLVLGLEVVLADGRVWNGLRTLRKDNTGYDIKDIFVGAEGTLGVITAVALKLFPKPREIATAWVAVPDPTAAVTLLGLCQDAFDSALTAFELISAPLVRLVVRHIPDTRNPLAGDHGWFVLIELAGSRPAGNLRDGLEQVLAGAIEQGTVLDAVVAQSERQGRAIWRLRHGVTEANRTHGVNFSHDVALPISRVPSFMERADQAIRRQFPRTDILSVSHLGDGNVHYTVTFPYPDAANIADPMALGGEVARPVHDLAVALGGSFAAEHGIGQRYRASLARYKSPVEIELFRRLKAALDPDGLMNPGRVIPD